MNEPEQTPDPFPWDDVRQKAAEALALGEFSTEQIAENAGVCRTTLWNWRQHPEFAARVEKRLEELGGEARRRGLAVLTRRVAALNDRYNRMRRLMEARADALAGVPGGDTGLLVRRVKGIGRGADFQVVEEYEFDAALFRELREHEKQAAQELGQWVDKVSSENRTLVSLDDQRAMVGDERMSELACELDERLAAPRDDPGGVRASGEQ